ncbi:MAG: IPT/TIG domain-containing protein [Bacteroidota bacterium]
MNKRVYAYWLLSLVVVAMLFHACSKEPDVNGTNPPVPSPAPDPAQPVPFIASFFPLTATGDEPVRIVGKYFSPSTAVSFGGTAAQSFKIVSDTVIFAYPGTGASGNIVVTSPAGTGTIGGFTFYIPPQYILYGTSAFGSVPWPQGDSSYYHPIFLPDTAFFVIKKINRYDSLAIGTNAYFPEYSRYVDSPNYVILSGVGLDPRGGYNFYGKTPSFRPLSVFARIVDSVITIPGQTPEYWLMIKGSGIIKNNKISLQYLTNYRGQSKSAILKSP